jgi:competence protein ComEC
MRRSGLAHLLAVSGFNVSLAAAAFLLAGWWLPGRWRYLPAGLGVLVYLLVVGPMAPILRATMMAVLVLAALSIQRPPQSANTLALTVAVLLLWRPEWIGDAGFQLTVAATAGLMFLTPLLEASWPGWPPALRRGVAASVAAQLATLPIVIATFHHATPLGIVANLFAVPWSALFMLASLAWCGVALVAPQLAGPVAPLLDMAASPFVALAATPAELWLVQPAAMSGGMAWLLGAACLSASLFPRRAWAWAGVVLLGLQCVPSRVFEAPSLALLDVGQGDAILLRGGGRAILVDGGGWSEGDFGGRVLMPALAGEGVRRLDAVVLTHSDRDHCGGLLDLVDYLDTAEIWAAPGVGEGCARQLLLRPGPRLRPLWRGEGRRLGAWSFEVLGPPPGAESARDNARSLILLARAGGASVLLTGDIATPEEWELLDWLPGGAIDVLKVAHHGSRSSTSEELLSRLRPRLALVSVGARNPFGHPHSTVMARLARRGVPTLRTDLAGEIFLTIEAGRLRIETPASPR